MRVCIATPLFPPQIGGPATYSKLISEELPKKGVDVEVVSFGDVLHLPKGVRHVVYMLKLLRKGISCDSIFAQDPVSVGLPAVFVAILLRRRFMVKVVGDYAWEQATQRFGVRDTLDVFTKRTQNYPWSVRVLRFVESNVARRASKVIVPSEYLKKIVESWGVESKKIKVIYNAFDMPEVTIVSKDTARASLLVSKDATVLLSVGRLVPWKGFKEVITLLPNLLDKFPRALLFVVGDGPDEEELKTLVDSNELLRNRVIFTGKVSKGVLYTYIQAADIFVLNTSYEGFSHQLLEVMFLGTPIVTTTAGGNTELLSEETGYLVSIGNTEQLEKEIVSALTYPLQAKEKSVRAKEFVKIFTREKMVNELLQLL